MFITSHTEARVSLFIGKDYLFKCFISVQLSGFASKPPRLLSFFYFSFFFFTSSTPSSLH